jgi:uncharacterized membrane protein YqhA
MKRIYLILSSVVSVIAILVFLAGIVVTMVGIYEFVIAFTYVSIDKHHMATLIAIGLLKAVDMFLMAMVFFVFSLGVLMLFSHPDATPQVKVPEWLRIKSFVDLKVILWEAILTTLVVSYLVGLAEAKMQGVQVSLSNLVIPGVIFLISLSLSLLKKGGNH